MTDKAEIKFAIRYLKQGLRSKRTPPLYEELMKELGFVKEYKVQELEEENESLENVKNIYIGDLLKAREIIKKFSEFVNNKVEYDPEHPQEHTDSWNELCEQAEQFLKG